jgi:O-antigen biosynthesis protein
LNRYKILGLQLDPWACGHFRLKYPLMTLRDKGHEVFITESGHPKWKLDRVDWKAGWTHVVCQRQVNPAILERLVDLRDATGCKLLYEVDDNLHQVHPQSHAFQVFKPGSDVIRVVERWIRTCDGLIVTTPELAGSYSYLNNRIYVVNNYLDLHIRDWTTPVPRAEDLAGKLVIGWAGGSTHTDDEAPLRGVLAGVLADYPRAVFGICTHPKLVERMVQTLEIPPEKVVHLQTVSFEDYPKVPAQFDIGLAPLRDTPFNRNKSALKVMEYGARGVPYVASDIAPYRRFHKETNGVGGFLAETKTDWDVALRTLIEQEDVWTKQGFNASKVIHEQYSLRGNIAKWEAVLDDILLESKTSVWTNNEKPGRNTTCPCGSQQKYKRCCYPAFG